MKTPNQWADDASRATTKRALTEIIAQAQADAIASVLQDICWVNQAGQGRLYTFAEDQLNKWIDKASELNGKR